MIKSDIQSLFPTPVYMANINRKLTNRELSFVEEQKKHCQSNKGNINTIDNYILNKPELKKIKKFLEECCDDYLQKVICPKHNPKLRITQSWLNYTEENQYHHQHEHPNSVVSGVFYINADKQNDNIKFFDRDYRQIFPAIDKFNSWNSTSWWFTTETGQLVMFPSSTSHQVDFKKGSNTRISLSFNTFYKGTIGENKDLAELIL